MKFCSKCQTEKPLAEFYRNPKQKLGVDNYCKACKSAYKRGRYREYDREYRAKHRERDRERDRERRRHWGAERRKHHNEVQRLWRARRRAMLTQTHTLTYT